VARFVPSFRSSSIRTFPSTSTSNGTTNVLFIVQIRSMLFRRAWLCCFIFWFACRLCKTFFDVMWYIFARVIFFDFWVIYKE
jgi:hypothetical protein